MGLKAYLDNCRQLREEMMLIRVLDEIIKETEETGEDPYANWPMSFEERDFDT
jgi:hypothetical protein